MPSFWKEPAGLIEDTMRSFCVEAVGTISKRIIAYKGNVNTNEDQLQALENNVAVLPDTVIVLESYLNRLISIEGRLPTDSQRVKEKNELNVTLMTLRRNLKGLLEMTGVISRATDHLEQGHVM